MQTFIFNTNLTDCQQAPWRLSANIVPGFSICSVFTCYIPHKINPKQNCSLAGLRRRAISDFSGGSPTIPQNILDLWLCAPAFQRVCPFRLVFNLLYSNPIITLCQVREYESNRLFLIVQILNGHLRSHFQFRGLSPEELEPKDKRLPNHKVLSSTEDCY
jgi:hypothetical protein